MDPQSSGAPSAVQGAAQEDSEQDLLCVCQQPYNVDTAMISCDVCEDWYHLRCLGMTQAAAKSMKKYTCPVCLALKGNSDPLQAALAKVGCCHVVWSPAYMLFPIHSKFPENPSLSLQPLAKNVNYATKGSLPCIFLVVMCHFPGFPQPLPAGRSIW